MYKIKLKPSTNTGWLTPAVKYKNVGATRFLT